MRKLALTCLMILGLAAAVAVSLARGPAPQASNASSHREAVRQTARKASWTASSASASSRRMRSARP